MLIMCFFKTGSIKWTQRKRNEFDKANKNDIENDINKLILEAGCKKENRNSSIMLAKTARTPQRERERKADSKEEEEGEGINEGNKDGTKFNLHSFTQVALAGRRDELVFQEQAGSDVKKNRCKFGGESHSVTPLLYVKIIFT